MHLGWDVLSVAAGGGGIPLRPVQVEGMWTPPAYLLADSSGRLHTTGVERNRPDLGLAIADVRDILGHPHIVVAGATWPAELVFRARLYNPLAEIGKHLRGKPDLVALPFPDNWPDAKVEMYAAMLEQLDVVVEPLPESVALSGYVRALGLVAPPSRTSPRGIGATGVHSDGRGMLVVAVHGDDEQPTESVDVPVDIEGMRDARSADNVVIEVMAAARSIGADTSTVLLSGSARFNDALRLAFQNHLGHRLRVADHPMHALVLGAVHLLVSDLEAAEAEQADVPHPEYPSGPAAQPTETVGRPRADRGGAVNPPPSRPAPRRDGPGHPAPPDDVTRGAGDHDAMRGLPPNTAELGSRFTRPPPVSDEQQASVFDRPQSGVSGTAGPLPGQVASPFDPGFGPRTVSHHSQSYPGGDRSQRRGPEAGAEPDHFGEPPGKGRFWNKMTGNLFGANAVVGTLALALVALAAGGSDRMEFAARSVGLDSRAVVGEAEVVAGPVAFATLGVGACPIVPYVIDGSEPGVAAARRNQSVAGGRADCAKAEMDTLHYSIPGAPGANDPGPPTEI